MSFYKLKISSIQRPIKNALTLSLTVPEHLKEKFKFNPGQHLIFKFKIEDNEIRRSYSLNSCPFTEVNLEVTVKRVKGGLISNYINDHLNEGDEVEVMSPQGRFHAIINEKAYKTYFLFAAGSGITPIISILKSVLHGSPNSMINLLYGNTNQDSIIFKEDLDQLKLKYGNRLQIIHTLSSPKYWTTSQSWKGRKGRIDNECIEWFIEQNPPIAQNTEYYICGPGAMNVAVKTALLGLGVPKHLIHIEQFGSVSSQGTKKINGYGDALLISQLKGHDYAFKVPEGKTLLDVLKSQNVNPPYSCESGVCGTCTAKLIKGKVEMKSCMALDEKDIDNGLILTCQSIPMSEKVEIEF